MNQIDRSFNLRALGIAPISGVLIGLSIVVAILSRLGADDGVLMHLFISTTGDPESGLLPEVLHGQAWRLLTPIFIHFGFIHLLFNLLWLKDLGAMIERLGSPRLFLSLVVVIGIVSNVGQYLIYGPFFGGMSGVVYGLLGFVWMKSKFDPASGYFLQQQTVVMMIGWFVLCWAGALGHVANGAHTAGLAAGIVWGFLSAKTRLRAAPPGWPS